MPRERLSRQLPVHLTRRPEHRPAELHPALDNARAVVAHRPLQRLGRVRLRGRRLGCDERELVEAQADLGVRAVGEVVQLAEVLDVRGGEGRVRV